MEGAIGWSTGLSASGISAPGLLRPQGTEWSTCMLPVSWNSLNIECRKDWHLDEGGKGEQANQDIAIGIAFAGGQQLDIGRCRLVLLVIR